MRTSPLDVLVAVPQHPDALVDMPRLRLHGDERDVVGHDVVELASDAGPLLEHRPVALLVLPLDPRRSQRRLGVPA